MQWFPLITQILVLLLVISPLQLSLVQNDLGFLWIGRINCILLFWLALAHSSLLKKLSLRYGRVVFTEGTFFLLAFGAGVTTLSLILYYDLVSLIAGIGISLLSMIVIYVLGGVVFGFIRVRRVQRKVLGKGVTVILGVGVLRFIGTLVQPFIPSVYTRILAMGGAVRDSIASLTFWEGSYPYDELLVTGSGGDDSPGGQFSGLSDTNADDSVVLDSVVEENTDNVDVINNDSSEQLNSNELGLKKFTAPVGIEQENIITYGDLIPYLVSFYGLSAPLADQYTFTYVPRYDTLYESFRVARWYGMIGTNTSPTSTVKCGNLFVMLGLAEGWEITVENDILSEYMSEAFVRGYVDAGCDEMDKDLTRDRLP